MTPDGNTILRPKRATEESAPSGYPWERFWCPRDASYRLDSDGYLFDPSGRGAQFFQPGIVPLESLAASPCLVLLGEAGSGKSTAVRDEVARLNRTPNGDATILIELGRTGTEEGLRSVILQSPAMATWREGQRTLHLFLDGLDEVLMGIPTAVEVIEDVLGSLPRKRLRVRVTCRPAVWPESFGRSLSGMWPESIGQPESARLAPKSCILYELLPLRHSDVETAARQEGFDSDSFLEAIADRGAQSLASNPLSLRMVIRTFRRDGCLPSGAHELYERGLVALCEQDQDRVRRGRATDLTPTQLVAIATHIAGLLVLTGKSAIYAGPEADRRGEDLPVGDVLGSSVGDGPDRVEVTRPAVDELLLDTGLFSGRGQHRLGFSHKTYGEVLAARFLRGSALSKGQRRSLLYVSGEQPPRVVPQLYETAAWLANSDPEFLRELSDVEPEALLLSDLSHAGPAIKERIVSGLLKNVEQHRTSYYHVFHLRRLFKRLKYEGLEAQLRPVISDVQRPTDVRHMAVDIADVCRLSGLAGPLTDLALDEAASTDLRHAACHALEHVAEPQHRSRLRPLALGHSGNDPDCILRGLAMEITWPDHLSSEELFGALIAPRGGSSVSAYYGVLHKSPIAARISVEDLPIALAWASRHRNQHTLEIVFHELADALMLRAWQHLDNPRVREAFAGAISGVWRLHAPIFRIPQAEEKGDPQLAEQAARDLIDRDPVRRRLLVEECLKVTANDERMPILTYGPTPLLGPEDFAWVVQRLEIAIDEQVPRWGKLAWTVFRENRLDHVELWIKAQERSKRVRDALPIPLEIRIKSAEAKGLRAAFNESKTWERDAKKHSILSPPRAERVRIVVEKALKNDPGWFPTLTEQLGLKSNGFAEYSADLTKSAGWHDADERTRAQIIDAALQYLLVVPGTSKSRKVVVLQHWHVAQAAVLLWLFKPEALSKMPDERLGILAPFILEGCRTLSDDGDGVGQAHREIIALLIKRVRSAAHNAALNALRVANAASALPDAFRSFEPYIEEAFAIDAVEILRTAPLSESNAIQVIAGLVEKGSPAGLAYAESLVRAYATTTESARTIGIMAAVALAKYTNDGRWSIIWPAMQADADWGEEFAKRFAEIPGSSTLQLAVRIGEPACAGLLTWLMQRFPPRPVLRGRYVRIDGVERVHYWRSEILNYLSGSGTEAACAALRALRDAFPSHTWLNTCLLDAEANRRRKTWVPPSPRVLIRLIADSERRYVNSAADLQAVVLESLAGLNVALHGTTPQVQFLWDKQGGRKNKGTSRPKDEPAISDFVAGWLRQGIGNDRGIVVNREIEIRRRTNQNGEAGQRTDISIDAVARRADGGILDVVTVIVEVKGCWHGEVKTAMESQLVGHYLTENQTRHGIYVVAWSWGVGWDKTDRRCKPKRWKSIDDCRSELAQQAASLTAKGAPGNGIAAYVLDCALR